MRRRVEVEPDDVAQLGRERRIVGELERPHPVRPELVARQMRSTELGLVPAAAAMALALQSVASCGGSEVVSATTRSIVSCARRGRRGGRVLSRSSPATPSRMKRSCQRRTHGFDLPVRRTISPVPSPSAVARMIPARQTCFCGLFRSATTASRRARSAVLISTLIPSRIPGRWGRARPSEIFRQTRSISAFISGDVIEAEIFRGYRKEIIRGTEINNIIDIRVLQVIAFHKDMISQISGGRIVIYTPRNVSCLAII